MARHLGTAAFLGIWLALTALPCEAHERWFVPEPQPGTDWSAFFSWPVLIALLAAAGTVAGLAALQRAIGDPLWPRPPLFQRLETAAPAILAVQAGITIIFAATRWNLFVPNLNLPHSAVGLAIASIAIATGFSYITGVFTRLGALLTIALLVYAFSLAPFEQVLEQVLFAGIAIYLMAVGRGTIRLDRPDDEDEPRWLVRLQPHALTILRVCTGASILVLAFTEKLLNHQLGVEFLQRYPDFNLGRDAGVHWLSDSRFVSAAGVVEACIGVALISGYLPRLVILAIWLPFNLGIPFLPPEELIGHLPILAASYVLLVRGSEGVPPRDHVPFVDKHAMLAAR